MLSLTIVSDILLFLDVDIGYLGFVPYLVGKLRKQNMFSLLLISSQIKKIK